MRRKHVAPYSIDAEEAVLGALMLNRDQVPIVIDIVTGPDFFQKSHEIVFEAIIEQWANNQPTDVVTLMEVLRRDGTLDSVGGKKKLLQLQASSPVSGHARSYAQAVAENGTLRRAIEYGERLTEAGYDADRGRVDELLDHASDHVLGSLAANADLRPPVDFMELTRVEREVQYIQPARIIRGDRIIITGGEGGGKSTFMRQSAVQIACGYKLFDMDEVPRMRVAYFDLQERQLQAEREFMRTRRIAEGHNRLPEPGGLQVVFRRQGFDILNRGDRRWFERHLTNMRPDIVFIGPLYKTFAGDKTDESIADQVSIIFDAIVERFDIAIVFEAHSPHGLANDRAGWRPYGASLWLRWPDMGIGLAPRKPPKPTKENPGPDPPKWWKPGRKIVSWRDPRDRGLRVWPDNLIYGADDYWPWVPFDGEVM